MTKSSNDNSKLYTVEEFVDLISADYYDKEDFIDWVKEGIHGHDKLSADRWMEQWRERESMFTNSEDSTNEDEFIVYTDDKEITVRKEDDNKWHGSDGKTFMGYLKPQDVLHWYRQDYGKACIDSSKQIKSSFEWADTSMYNPYFGGKPGATYYAGWFVDNETPWVFVEGEISTGKMTVLGAFATEAEANQFGDNYKLKGPGYDYEVSNVLEGMDFDDLYAESLVSSKQIKSTKSNWKELMDDSDWDYGNPESYEVWDDNLEVSFRNPDKQKAEEFYNTHPESLYLIEYLEHGNRIIKSKENNMMVSVMTVK